VIKCDVLFFDLLWRFAFDFLNKLSINSENPYVFYPKNNKFEENKNSYSANSKIIQNTPLKNDESRGGKENNINEINCQNFISQAPKLDIKNSNSDYKSKCILSPQNKCDADEYMGLSYLNGRANTIISPSRSDDTNVSEDVSGTSGPKIPLVKKKIGRY